MTVAPRVLAGLGVRPAHGQALDGTVILTTAAAVWFADAIGLTIGLTWLVIAGAVVSRTRQRVVVTPAGTRLPAGPVPAPTFS